MCEIDLEPADVFLDTSHKARKEHRCACCGGPIARGERYLRHFQVFEGTAISERCCAACAADREAFADADGHGFSAPSYFPEMLSNCIFFDDGDVVVSVAERAANNRWIAMRDGIRARAKKARGE